MFQIQLFLDNVMTANKIIEAVGKVFTSEAAILLLGVGGIGIQFVGK